jgi:hypothetical protein
MLPLFDLSGHGALDDDDIASLRTGYFLNAPNDNNSNSVLVFDRYKEHEWHLIDPNRNYRVTFYVIAVAAEEQRQRLKQQQTQEQEQLPSSYSPSLIVLNIIRAMPKFKQKANIFSKLFQETSPIRLKFMHTLFITQSDYSAFFLRMVIPAVDRNLRWMFPHLTLGLFCSIDAVLQKLLSMGFRVDGLPPSLGGTWEYQPPETLPATITREPSIADLPQLPVGHTLQQNSPSFLSLNQQQPINSITDYLLNSYEETTNQQLLGEGPNIVNDALLFNFIQHNKNNAEEARKHIHLFAELSQQLFHNSLILNTTGVGCKCMRCFIFQAPATYQASEMFLLCS